MPTQQRAARRSNCLGVPEAAQYGHAALFVVRQFERRAARCCVGIRAKALQAGRRQQFRLPSQDVEGEIRGEQRAPDPLGDAGVVVDRDTGRAAGRHEVGIALVDKRAQRVTLTPGWDWRVHPPHCASGQRPR